MNQVSPGLDRVRHCIAIASGKGGVGKSTVTTNLAFALTKQGHKVGIMDSDLYGPCQPGLLGNKGKPTGHQGHIVPVESHGIKFVSMGHMGADDEAMIIRAPMAIKAMTQFLSGVIWGELDFLLIDLPPGTGDIQLSLAQQARLSGAIIVTTPQRVAVDVARKGAQMFETLNVPLLGIVENMSGYTCGHCNTTTPIFQTGGGDLLADQFQTTVLGKVPMDPEIMRCGDEGKSLIDTYPESSSAKAYMEMAKEFSENVEMLAQKTASVEPQNIQLFEDDAQLNIQWKDGTERTYNAYDLRLSCPCASCVDENTGKKLLSPDQVPMDLKIQGARSVGRYGISIQFSDGHGTGIYKFDKLKTEFNSAPEQGLQV